MFCKQGILNLKNSQKNTCAGVSFLIRDYQKETLMQVFCCEFRKTLRTPLFAEHVQWLRLVFKTFFSYFYFHLFLTLFLSILEGTV